MPKMKRGVARVWRLVSWVRAVRANGFLPLIAVKTLPPPPLSSSTSERYKGETRRHTPSLAPQIIFNLNPFAVVMDLHNKVRRKSDICGVKDLIEVRETKLTRLQHKMDKEDKERSDREIELTEKLAEAEARITNIKRAIEGHNHNVTELIRTTQDEVSWSESVSPHHAT